MANVTIYGIPNCDSIKKTIDWCNKYKISFEFHNYKKDGIEEATLKSWCEQVGWEVLLNKKGTTWKKVADEYADKKMTEKMAIKLMLEYNSMIKRPVIKKGKQIIVGFDENVLLKALKK